MKRRRADSVLTPQLTEQTQTIFGQNTNASGQEQGAVEASNKRGNQVSAKLQVPSGAYVRTGLINLQKKGTHMRNPLLSIFSEKPTATSSSISGTEEATDLSGTATSYSQGSSDGTHDAPLKVEKKLKTKKRRSKLLKSHKKALMKLKPEERAKHLWAVRQWKKRNQLLLKNRIQVKSTANQIIQNDQKEFLLRMFEDRQASIGASVQVQKVQIGSPVRNANMYRSRLLFERNSRPLNTESYGDSDQEDDDDESFAESQDATVIRQISSSQPLPATDYSNTATISGVVPFHVSPSLSSIDDLGPTGTLNTATGDSSQQQQPHHQQSLEPQQLLSRQDDDGTTTYNLEAYLSQISREEEEEE